MTTENCLTKYATEGERTKAKRIVRAALKAGYRVSVNDGEEWTVKKSDNFNTIIDALATTGQDHLAIWTGDKTTKLGWIGLIYGNAKDGSELAYDYTDNPVVASIANA